MALPQPKTSELIDLLGPSLQKGECLLNDFELMRALNETRKLSDDVDRLFVQGMIRLVEGRDEDAYSLIERSLSINPSNEEVWINYFKAVNNKGYYHKALSILNSSINYPFPAILNQCYEKGTTWGRVDMASEAKRKLKLMGLFDKERFSEGIHSLYDDFSLLGNEKDDFQAICGIISEVAQKYNVKVVGNRIEFMDTISIISHVKTKDDELLSMMNFDVIDLIVMRGLERNNCIGFFDAGGE
ncbi:TPA: tetratricopeptide repeat protein [Klebsiella michiganensis]